MTKPPPRNVSGGRWRPERDGHPGRAQRGPTPRPGRGGGGPSGDREPGEEGWLWGLHAVAAALANPRRRVRAALLTRNAAARLGLAEPLAAGFRLAAPEEIDAALPRGAVHQGAALRADPLEPLELADAAAGAGPLALIDQVTDPQNVGAVFRSAAAFGAAGVIMQTRRAPALAGALAKAAAGAVETVAEIRAVNLARAVDLLVGEGWTVIGLDGAAGATLAEAVAAAGDDARIALALGAEGAGLRPAVARACSRLARIPIEPAMESLNVAAAAAIGLHELHRRAGRAPPPAAARLASADAPEGESD